MPSAANRCPSSTSPAERRKAAWSARRERLWMASVYTFSFVFIALVTAEFIYSKSVSALSPATEVTFINGAGEDSAGPGCRRRPAPLPGAGKGHAKSASGSTRSPTERSPRCSTPARSAARWAFTRPANGVVCKNCAAPINPQSVGTNGGCNPIPLKATQTADAVIIQEADIAAGSRMFAQP